KAAPDFPAMGSSGPPFRVSGGTFMDIPEELELYYVAPNGWICHFSGGHLHGAEGITLRSGPNGSAIEDMLEAPFEAIYESTAFELGGHYQGLKENMFDFTLAFNVRNTGERPWRVNYSKFRKA